MRWVAFLVALITTSTSGAATELTGRASVIDGDTIEIRGERFGLPPLEEVAVSKRGDGIAADGCVAAMASP